MLDKSLNRSDTFYEKARIFSHDYLKCCIFITELKVNDDVFCKKLYSELISSSQILEDFLDIHGAKNNTNWFLYRELSAAVRHISLGGFSQRHILNRLKNYKLDDVGEFEKDGEATLNFLNDSLKKLAPVIIDEADRLSIPFPDDRFNVEDFPDVMSTDFLENDIDDEAREQQKVEVVKIASEFLEIAKHFDRFEFYEPVNMDRIKAMVPAEIDEVNIRKYEMLVHNLQSYFDTYVGQGGFKSKNKKLQMFRSYFSVVFHLLQQMGRLLHFYERHLHDPGYKDIYKKVKTQLSFLVNPEILLDRTINYALFYACHFLNTGKILVQQILNENIERTSIVVNIPKQHGFHTRPSLLVAKIVQHYGGHVDLCVGDDRFDASSVLDIQWAGGKIQKEEISQVRFEGDVRALRDIEILASVNYCEEAMGKGVSIPKELDYLGVCQI